VCGRYKLFQCCDYAKRVLSYQTEFLVEVPDLHPSLGPTFSQVMVRWGACQARARLDPSSRCSVCNVCCCLPVLYCAVVSQLITRAEFVELNKVDFDKAIGKHDLGRIAARRTHMSLTQRFSNLDWNKGFVHCSSADTRASFPCDPFLSHGP
jgi:hypothetical protein